MLKQVCTDLWVAEQPLRFAGIEVGCRMTVVRLPGGGVIVHSPIECVAELRNEVQSIGEVGWIVAPNRFHHLYLDSWKEAFPNASVLIAPGLETKRPDLESAKALSEESPADWAGAVETQPLEGFPLANECVFLHRPSSTLIATDLAFNFGSEAPLGTRLLIRLAGRLGELAPTRLERLLIRDPVAFRRSLDRVLEWSFDRVIVSHGEIVESGGREQLAKGYAWLPPLVDGA